MPRTRSPRRSRLAAIVSGALALTGLQLLLIAPAAPASVSGPTSSAALAGPTTDVQILGTNDFHGRIANESASGTAGAGVMAGAVNQLRTANPNTAFVAAGDLIGASTFESFILQDEPTIDALNAAGLDVSAAGNHEFDQGYADLAGRVQDRADFEYIAANVRKNSDDSHALAPTWTQEFGSVKVGYVGAVTEHLPELVSPGGISEIHVTDIVDEVNDAAADLKADGADLVVMLVHEGAPMTNCTQIQALATDTDFGSIVQGVSDDVDAIVSGHTHLAYNCSFPVPGWVTEGRVVTERPVVSAGQYATNLNQIVFTVDDATGEVQAKSQALLALKSCTNSTACTNYPVHQPTQDVVDAALAEAAPLGAAPLGQIAAPIKRAYLANGTTENRGAESAVGNLVAEAQRWRMSAPEFGAAEIGFMNPGGLRQDMLGTGAVGDPYPRTLTYKQAAEVQPFANGLVNMDMTGAQIKAALEQQWQPSGASRPFLKLGISKGFTYTSVPPPSGAPAGTKGTITGMWLNGTPVGLSDTYSVAVNSFLATGGDNFPAFNVPGQAQYGQTDLQAMVDYMDEFANTGEGDDPLPVPSEQNGVHVVFPDGAPSTYEPGEHVLFDVSGWSFTSAPQDTQIDVKLDGDTIGTATLDNAAQVATPGFDVTGTASIDVVIPADQASGPLTLLLVGPTTGTEIPVVVNATHLQEIAADDVTVTYGEEADLVVTVTGNSGAAGGSVEFFSGATSLGTAPMVGGTATLTLAERSFPPGTHTITAEYSGAGDYVADTVELDLTVEKADATVVADDTSTAADSTTVHVTVSSTIGVNPTGTVEIYDGDELLGAKSLSGGSANVLVDTSGLAVGPHELDVVYNGSQFFNGDDSTFTLTRDKASPVLAVTAPTMTYGKSSVVTVNVSAPGETPTGTVQVRRGASVIGTGTVTNGKATITLPARSLPPGSIALTAVYSGDANVAASSKAFTLTVDKAKANVDITLKPDTFKVNKTKGKVVVRVSADGVDPVTGKVEITVQGQGTKKVTLVDGKAVLDLAVFKQTGKKSVKVTYLGSSLVAEATEKAVITVKP